MASSQLSPCKIRPWTTRLKMRPCSVNLLAVLILAALPYISTLTLPSGDPAPGRSPGPPETELYPEVDTVSSDVTVEPTEVASSVASEIDACAFARVPSESETVVTLSETDSDVNLTVGHAVFETDQLVRGVIYDVTVRMAYSLDLFEQDIDDIFSSVIGPVFSVERTPHAITNNTRTLDPQVTDYLTLSPIRHNSEKPSQPPSFRAPLPHDTAQINEEEPTKHRLNMVAQNEFQLNKLLDEPIHTIPDFDKDVFTLYTRKFDEIRAEYMITKAEDQKNGAATDYRRSRVKFMPDEYLSVINQDVLAHIAKTRGLDYAKLQRANAVGLLNQYFISDRNALERVLRLMEQFVYGARYKFLYAQKLKARYARNLQYRIGYTFGVIENLLHQFYAVYYSMTKLKLNPNEIAGQIDYMTYLKLYERTISIQVEYKGVIDFLRDLEEMREAHVSKRTDVGQMKDNVFIKRRK